MSVDIDPLTADCGIRVTDHIENAQFELYTDRDIRPVGTDGTEHYFPVDASVRFEAGSITIPRVANVVVHGADGGIVAEGIDVDLPPGTYDVQVTPSPAKTYLHVESAFRLVPSEETSRIEFDGGTTVMAGFRSMHERPAGTITTPRDPESVMDAVSLLGSSLATTSPERSFPSLRGHPPLIELGESFSVPDTVSPVETDVRIVVPPKFEYVFAVATLAHYLGAEVVPGAEPRLEGNGWDYPLEPSFERRVSRVLRQVFHLDCVVRTEGFYPIDLHERGVLDEFGARDERLDLDYARLYDAPLEARLREYLDVPFAELEPVLPQWSLTTDIRPNPENVSILPYVAGDLSLVRCPVPGGDAGDPEPTHVSEFLRSPTDLTANGSGAEPFAGAGTEPPADTEPCAPQGRSMVPGATDRDVMRGATDRDVMRGSTARGAGFTADDEEFIQPDAVDTVEHAWVGSGVPLGANKATVEAYKRRIGSDAPERGPISVVVVCNDDRMREEGDVADLYGLRDMLQFNIDVKHDLTEAEMRELLATDVDFLHYIGHVDERGMQCVDGFLDLTAATTDVNVDSFLLNACQSYKQGRALVDAGSRGGIVTITDVANSPATQLGRIIARLMNSGFNLRTALHVAQRALITGHQYGVLGDGGVTLCQSRSGAASVYRMEQLDDEHFDLSVTTYPLGAFGTGSLFTLSSDAFEDHCLVPSTVTLEGLPTAKVERLLKLEVVPVFCENELHWSDELLPL